VLNLPAPDRTPLSNAALPLVVAQARFDSVAAALDQAALRHIQATLREYGLDSPQVNAVTAMDVIVGPGQQGQATSTVNGWQLIADDGQVQVTVMPDSAALETPAFRSYDGQFGPQLAAVLAAVTDTHAPVTTRRLGIRFVNVLKTPAGEDPGDWSRWIRPSLCAPLNDSDLAAGVVGVAHQLVLHVANGVYSTVRAGAVEADGPAWLLDIDTFTEPSQLWSSDDVKGGFDELNAHGVAVFQALITRDMLNYLRTGQQMEGQGR
jgi:uncharacterized protein (TIGR04255 family)